MAQIRVGLIGGGGIATAHIRGYREHADRIGVTAVADSRPEVAQTRAEELGATPYTDYLELIADPAVDAVDICLPHHLLRDAIVAAADAGKHILCEKPLCLTAEEARAVQEAIRRSGVVLMCAHNQLFLPPVAKARELLDSGAIGIVYEVRTNDCFVNPFNPENMGWRASAVTSGGGELIDTGYHPSYLLLHLAGGVPIEATAMLATHRLRFMEGEDSAQVLVRFDNNVLGHIVTSWAFDLPRTGERFSAVGERGTLHGDTTSLRLRSIEGEVQTWEFDKVDTFVGEIGHFADSLMNGTRPLHTEKEGIEVLGMILAAYEGARTRTIAPVIRAEVGATPA